MKRNIRLTIEYDGSRYQAGRGLVVIPMRIRFKEN